MRRFTRRRKKSVDQASVRGHGSAGIHQEDESNRVLAIRIEDQFDLSALPAGLSDRFVEIEDLFALTAEASQRTQRSLELTHVDRDVGTVIAVPTVLRDLNGRATPSPAVAHMDPGRVLPGVSPRAGPTRPDPAVPAIVTLFLLVQGLLELLAQLLQRHARHPLERLRRQTGGLHGGRQPRLDRVGDLLDFGAVEGLREGEVEGVEAALTVDEHRPPDSVETLQIVDEFAAQGLMERQPLVRPHGQPPAAQGEEEVGEHPRPTPRRACARRVRRPAPASAMRRGTAGSARCPPGRGLRA